MNKSHASALVAALLAASLGAAHAQSLPIPAAAAKSAATTDAKAIPTPAPAAARTAMPSCTNPDALGVSRVVEIDTTGGPGFGFEHFKAYDFLRMNEVVFTFDDGPWPHNTPMVLDALAAQCVKATFFPVGKHATWHPDILKRVAEQGHTIGSHTWSHADLSRLAAKDARDEIEKGISAVRVVLGAPAAPFFRFPSLKHPPELVTYLGERGIGIFSTDMDSFDFKIRKPEQVINSLMAKLKKHGKGIVLMHDFQRVTAEALPELLNRLKAEGYKVVHMKAKEPVQTLSAYDEQIVKDMPGAGAGQRPISNVVRTIAE